VTVAGWLVLVAGAAGDAVVWVVVDPHAVRPNVSAAAVPATATVARVFMDLIWVIFFPGDALRWFGPARRWLGRDVESRTPP